MTAEVVIYCVAMMNDIEATIKVMETVRLEIHNTKTSEDTVFLSTSKNLDDEGTRNTHC